MFKKKATNKLVSLLMALLLLFSAAAPTVFAEETNGTEASSVAESVYATETGESEISLAAQAETSLLPGSPGYLAYEFLEYLSSTIGTRVAGSVQDVYARDYIAEQFAAMGLDVARQDFSYTRSGTTVQTQNIVATKPGASPKVLIVGAHFDSVSAGKGTDDNASGVAVMLETAKNVAQLPTPYTVKFVAFGAEEQGLRGSNYYVSQMSDEDKKNTVAMINLDSLAVGDHMYIYGGAGEQGFVRDQGLAIAERLGLNLQTNPGINPDYPAGTTGDWSDHAPFKRAGIPYGYLEATNWTLGDLDGYTQTEQDGEIWHTPKDNLEYISANYPGRIEERLSTFTQVLTHLVLELEVPVQELQVSTDKASMTEKRTIDVEFQLLNASTLNDLQWTFGGKPLSEWKSWSTSPSPAGYNGAPFIYLEEPPTVNGTTVTAKVTFDLVYGTSNLSGSFRSRYPALIGTYDLAVLDGAGETIAKAPVKLNVYDDYHTYDEIKPAIDAIAESPDRVDGRYAEYKVIGKSGQGRDIHFSIVARDKASVDQYLNETMPMMLNNPEALQEKVKSGSLGDYKVPIWINNIHPDEAPGVDAIITMFDTLLTDEYVTYETTDASGTPQTVVLDIDKALDNVIFLLDYTENPDGRYLNTRANAAGFDLNRDNSYQTQPETQQVMEELAKWTPLSFLDLHGFVGEFLIEPCTPPHDPNFEYDLLIDNMLEQANAMGRAGVANTKYDSYLIPYEEHQRGTDSGYATGWDDASPAYTAVFAMHHGALGHTIEIPELNQDSADALYYTLLAATNYVVENKDKLFLNQLEVFKRGIENEDNRNVDQYLINASDEVIGRPRGEHENFFPEYYVLPVNSELQKNPVEVYKMVQYLLRNGVKVEQTIEPVALEGVPYPAGTYVVNMHQAKRGFANLVLYDGIDVSDFSAMYSDIIQDFPVMRGFDLVAVRQSGVFSGRTSQVNAVSVPETSFPGNSTHYIIRNNGNAAIQAVNELIAAGKSVTLLSEGGEGYEKGDFLVSYANLKGLKAKYLLTLVPFPDDGGKEGKVLKAPVVGTSDRVTDFVLRQLGFTVSSDASASGVLVNSVNKNEILAGKPYVGFGRTGMNALRNNSLLTEEGFAFTSQSSYEGLYKAVFAQDNVITAPYAETDYLYTNTGSYITSLPEGAIELARIGDGEDFFKAGWWPTRDNAKGQYAGFLYKQNGLNITVFASDSLNKDHPQAQFRLLANAIYAAAPELGENETMDDGVTERPYNYNPIPTNPGTPTSPETPADPEAPAEPETPTDPGTPEPPEFNDLDSVPWAADAILELAAKGIVNGVGDGTFAPQREVTRAEFLAMLIRAFDLLDEEATVSFGDVSSSSWSYPYIASAVKLGLVQGVGGGKFDPARPITREEITVMAANVLKFVAGAQTADGEAALSKFKDGGSIASFAKEAVALLTENGVITGVGADLFLPKGVASRAQAAVVISRLLNLKL
ncbi:MULTISPECIES: M20/M25/M40 family metallo-hydrolase [Cohnella]|uniref:M20/M25/M40 family metallo-hydrolase n=1 Tax=Cohnella TaxID=329857 RepID=UPI0009B98B1C|nr:MULTISPECIES: M20/M25/M40 family metallo-hydrolase [Cohnella]MBN2982897.1 M20/M25/M40 family metallo-hydrolase [Cohnella algarum]